MWLFGRISAKIFCHFCSVCSNVLATHDTSDWEFVSFKIRKNSQILHWLTKFIKICKKKMCGLPVKYYSSTTWWRQLGAEESPLVAGALLHLPSSESWLCWCLKQMFASILYTSEMLWRWQIRIPVSTICTVRTPPIHCSMNEDKVRGESIL